MSASTIFVALHLCAAASLVELADATAFLRAESKGATGQVRVVDVGNALSSELTGALFGGYGEAKLSSVELALRTMFATLPKNKHGNLGSAGVRYALHRFFVKKHGWFVKGLELGGSAQNLSSPTKILKDRVPSYIEGKLEQHLGGRGFDLRHLAVLASTIEYLVHEEAMGRLQASYLAHQLIPTDLVTRQEAGEIIDAYMISQILAVNLSALTTLQLSRLKQYIAPRAYPGWRDTQEWIRDMQLSIVYTDRGVDNPFVGGELSFARVAHVAEGIGDRYGKFQDLECQGLKEALMERESDVPGRVQISEFYRTGLDGKFLFNEKLELLRQLGALDESDPNVPSVVVPNYLSSPSNCLGKKSVFYSVCCISHCEGLMGHLENSIGMPTAQPQRIAAIVAAMPSDTIDAPRNLSSALLGRLDSIAQRHGGHVPLHGRLFAQWMHHAYPNECPYPQLVVEGAMQAAYTREPWTAVTRVEMSSWVSNATSDEEANPVAEKQLPWMDVEELLVELEALPVKSAHGNFWTVLCNLGLVCALLSFAAMVAQTSTSALSSHDDCKCQKYSV